jgi:predicted nucleotidyltransferase
MPFQELVDAIVTDSDLLGAIDQLLAIKRAVGEGEHGSPFPIINAFIDAELSRLETVLPPVLRDTDYSILDRLLMDTVLAGETKK